jgi:hypothetical protein
LPDPSVIPVPITVPDPSVSVMSVLISPIPVIVGVESVVKNGPMRSPPILVIVGATGASVSIVRENGAAELTFPDGSVLVIV